MIGYRVTTTGSDKELIVKNADWFAPYIEEAALKNGEVKTYTIEVLNVDESALTELSEFKGFN